MLRPNRSLLVTAVATLAIASAVATVGLVAPAAQAAHATATSLLSCTGSKLTRPQGTVVLACADGNIEISKTDWKRWTSASASGTTTLAINLCTPTCVKSKMSSFPDSSVRLSDVEHSSSGAVFSKATISYEHAGREATVTAYPRT